MASAWGLSWAGAWGGSWGAIAQPGGPNTGGSGGKKPARKPEMWYPHLAEPTSRRPIQVGGYGDAMAAAILATGAAII